jgi:hypothetical protein
MFAGQIQAISAPRFGHVREILVRDKKLRENQVQITEKTG